MGKNLIVRDANNQLVVLDVDRVVQLIEQEDMNVLGLSIEAIKAMKKWFYKFGGIPSASSAIDVEEVFNGAFQKFIEDPILTKEDISG